MSGNGYCSDSFVAATTMRSRRKRRDSCRSFTCISPRFLFSRWFNGDKIRVPKNRMEREWGEQTKGKDGVVKRLGSNLDEASSAFDSSAENGKDASFNLGVGLGLIYLVAASRNELNKMVDMHKKMEMLLQNFQNEVQNQEKKSLSPLPSISNHPSPISSSTVVQHMSYVDDEEHETSQFSSTQNAKYPEICLGSNGYRRGNSLRMDQLEVELAAEFDRLQFQMDAEIFRNYSKRRFSEISVVEVAPEETEETPQLQGPYHIEEDIEQPNNEYYAVPPRELEKRLHELLEARLQERIGELESSLECAMQQLEEKERERSWWQDTARLISQHLPAHPSRMLMSKGVEQPILINGEEGTKILSLEYEKRFNT